MMAAKRVGVLSAAAIVGLAAAVVASAQTPLAFQASENPSTVVMQLTQDVGVEGDDTPLLRIYGDGRVLVHFPVYMRRAGDYGLRLDSTELDGLLQTFVQGGWLISPSSACARRSAKCAAPADATRWRRAARWR